MRCPNCGVTLPDGSNECPKCGAEFEISFKSVPDGAASSSNSGDGDTGEPVAPEEPAASQQEPGEVSEGAKNDDPDRAASEEPSPKWYASTWFTVLMCFLLPPAGIIFTWKFKRPAKIIYRIVLTVVAALLIVLGVSLVLDESPSKTMGATVEYNGMQYVEPKGWVKETNDDGDPVYILDRSDSSSKAKAKIYLFATNEKADTRGDMADLAAVAQSSLYKQQSNPQVTNTRQIDSVDGAILVASDFTAENDDGTSYPGKLTVVSMADGQICALYCCFDGDDSTESAYDSLIASIKMTDDERSAIAALPDGSDPSDSSSSSSSSASSSSATSSSSSSAAKKTFAQTLSTFDFAEQTVSGKGDDVVAIPTSQPCVMDVTNKGSSNFVVKTLDSSGDQLDLLVNTIGAYDGTITDYQHSDGASSLEVKSSGSWSITFRPLSSIEPAKNGGTYSGDGVVLIDEGSISKVHFTNTGDGNFVVRAVGLNNGKLLVNEIGPYDGTVAWSEPQAFFIVTSDGDWTISW
jgi:hypothetical protein